MISSRQTILDRLAGVVSQSPADREPSQLVPGVLQTQDTTPAALIERFTKALDKLSVTWEVAENPIVARLKLVSGLKEGGVQRLLTWSADELPVGGILEALEVLGIATMTPDLRVLPVKLRPQDPPGRAELLASMETVEIGITGADAAIAETGTLFIAGGVGRPLLVSQMPRQHRVLLPASRLYPTIESWLAAQRLAEPAQRRVGSLTALTGVSRSRDIELHPSVGVHGPRRRHVIIVQGI